MGTMTCPDCSTEVPDSESKCSKCGKSIIKAPPHAFLDEVRNRNSARTMLPAMIVILCLLFAFGTEKWVEIFEAAKSIAGIVDERPKDPYPNWESKAVLEFENHISSMSWIENSNQVLVITDSSDVYIFNPVDPHVQDPKKVALDLKVFDERTFSSGGYFTLGPKGLLVVGPVFSWNEIRKGGRVYHGKGVRLRLDIWDILNRKHIRTIDTVIKDKSGYGSLRQPSKIHSDGKLIVFLDRGDLRVWNLITGKEQFIFPGTGGAGFSFNERGTHLASFTSKGTLSIWDITTGKKINEFADCLHNPEWGSGDGVALSPDGSKVALALYGGHGISVNTNSDNIQTVTWVIQIRETKTGKILHNLPGHTPMRFSPDGTLLAFGNGPQIRIQNVLSGEIQYEVKGHIRNPTSLIFGKDGKTLISGSKDGSVRIWKKPD